MREYIRDEHLVEEDEETLALATHVHFDHSGGLHYFSKVGIHQSEVAALETGDQVRAVTWLSDSEISVPPYQGWEASHYKVKPTRVTTPLHHEDIIQHGSIRLRVLHLPGHSSDSVIFLEESKGWIFSGDVLYSGGLIDWLPSSNVEKYRQSMQEIISLLSDPQCMTVFPGHGPMLDMGQARHIAQSYLDNSGTLQNISSSCISCVAGVALKIKNI